MSHEPFSIDRPGAAATITCVTTTTRAKKTLAAVPQIGIAPVDETPEQPIHATITFAGRTMQVQAPTAEQIGVWRRTAERFQSADIVPKEGDSDEVLVAKNTKAGKLLDRGIRIVESVLPDEDDHDWLEDQMLDRKLTLAAAAEILSLAADAYGQAVKAPTTGPAPKARRRR